MVPVHVTPVGFSLPYLVAGVVVLALMVWGVALVIAAFRRP